MIYQLSLKVEREYIIALPSTDDELSTFTEDRKKITSFPQNYGISPIMGLNFFFNQGNPPGKGNKLSQIKRLPLVKILT